MLQLNLKFGATSQYNIDSPVGFINLGAVVTEALKYVFPISGLLLFIYLIMGGFTYFTSGGDPKTTEKAKGQITNALIGFLIIFVAYWLVQALDFVFGDPGFLK